MLQHDGTLDRQALGRLVFSDASARADLEAIVHPLVYRQIDQWFADLPSGTRVALADIPLLFETGHEHDFERVVVCACDAGRAVAAHHGAGSAGCGGGEGESRRTVAHLREDQAGGLRDHDRLDVRGDGSPGPQSLRDPVDRRRELVSS